VVAVSFEELAVKIRFFYKVLPFNTFFIPIPL